MKQEGQIPLPEAFLERMDRLLGEEYQEFIESYGNDRVQGLRFNPLKWGDEEEGEEWKEYVAGIEKKFGLRKIPWTKEGYYYQGDARPGKHPLHQAGAYYIQEPSAMAAVELLNPGPGERILDLCAAPGGKTTQIAGRMKQAGLLVSNEIHPARARILSQNVERMGIGNAVVTNQDSRTLSARFPEFFHRILVDAPCSGEGMFRKDEEARREWSPEHVRLCARRQEEILEDAAGMLESGGRLVYSTCTFSPEENEGSIREFLKRHREFSLEEELPEGFSSFGHGRPDWIEDGVGELSKTFRIWPHRTEGEGHFLAVLRKNGPEDRKEPSTGRECLTGEKLFSGQCPKEGRGAFEKGKKKSGTASEAWETWRRFAETELSLSFADKDRQTAESEKSVLETGVPVMFGEQLYLIPPEMKDMSGLKVLRPGLHLGEVKKNRFEPSHSLALYLKKQQVKQWIRLDADGPLIEKYLSGQAMDGGSLKGAGASELKKGWVLILADNCSAGWAKLAGNTLKNHYPKGLRRQ